MPERLPPRKPGEAPAAAGPGTAAPATSAGQFDLFARRGTVAPEQRKVYSVTELTREIKAVLEGRFPSVLVRGEVSNLRAPSSGHLYFTLKDADACLDAVLFRTEARRLKFSVEDGLSLIARGRLVLYEPKGGYQLVCDTLEPVGAGALRLAFEQLKTRLEREGLFDRARKRALPFIPRRIALVTSPSGAVVHDFLRVLHRRFPNLPVLVVPARVQGEGSGQEIARAIVRAAQQPRVDVVVVARGGGSLEDLWAFNEEVVARALCACPVPTISAVGHETDVTIADFCADVRAPTPTAAAELLAKVKEELLVDLAQRRARLSRALRGSLERKRAQLDRARARLTDPRRLIGDRKLRLDRLRQRLEDLLRRDLAQRALKLRKQRERLQEQHPRERLRRLLAEVARLEERMATVLQRSQVARRHQLQSLALRLDALSPLRVLARGYSVTFDAAGHALRSAKAARPGERLRIRLQDGELTALVLAAEDDGENGPAPGPLQE